MTSSINNEPEQKQTYYIVYDDLYTKICIQKKHNSFLDISDNIGHQKSHPLRSCCYVSLPTF